MTTLRGISNEGGGIGVKHLPFFKKITTSLKQKSSWFEKTLPKKHPGYAAVPLEYRIIKGTAFHKKNFIKCKNVHLNLQKYKMKIP